jgi:hypothetical protein
VPFAHDAYLSDLNDQLKAGFSGAAPQEGAGHPTVSDLAERIKALRAANTVEATPQRIGQRRGEAVEPVTTRMHSKTGVNSVDFSGDMVRVVNTDPLLDSTATPGTCSDLDQHKNTTDEECKTSSGTTFTERIARRRKVLAKTQEFN